MNGLKTKKIFTFRNIDCLKNDLIELQTEVEKDFLGKLKDLSNTAKGDDLND